MRKRFYLMILCGLIFACSTENSSHEENEFTGTEVLSKDIQTFTQQSRRIIKGGNQIGKMKEVRHYDGNEKLQYCAVYDYSQSDKTTKSGTVTVILYNDENKREDKGRIIYKYNDKKVLIEFFDKGKTVADEAEYIEYIDEDFKFYTKYCQYVPQEDNKVLCYRVVKFNENTFDYIKETDYLANGLKWDSAKHEPIGELTVSEENLCTYNTTAIPDTNGKQHQWINEVYHVNEYNENGEKLSEREYQYNFLWNENICKTTHIQQNSYECDLETHTQMSPNDIVMKSFQLYGNEWKVKRKTWISAEGETKYYYNYEYAAEPNNASDYYESSEELIETSDGIKDVNYKKKYSHYIDENNDLIYEETELSGNEQSRSAANSKFSFSHAPKRHVRGR